MTDSASIPVHTREAARRTYDLSLLEQASLGRNDHTEAFGAAIAAALDALMTDEPAQVWASHFRGDPFHPNCLQYVRPSDVLAAVLAQADGS